MSWFLLKNRRHVGPYTREQLDQLRDQGQVDASDFVISQKELDEGTIKYRSVTEILRFQPRAPKGAVSTGLARSLNAEPATSKTAEKNVVAPAVAAQDDKFEPRLGSFSDEELANNEVSRVFTSLVDSVDLIRGTNAGLLPSHPPKKAPKAASQKTVTNFQAPAPQALAPVSTDASHSGFADDLATHSSFARLKEWISSPAGLSFLLLIVLGGGAFYLASNGALDKGWSGLFGSKAKAPANAARSAARPQQFAGPTGPSSGPTAPSRPHPSASMPQVQPQNGANRPVASRPPARPMPGRTPASQAPGHGIRLPTHREEPAPHPQDRGNENEDNNSANNSARDNRSPSSSDNGNDVDRNNDRNSDRDNDHANDHADDRGGASNNERERPFGRDRPPMPGRNIDSVDGANPSDANEAPNGPTGPDASRE